MQTLALMLVAVGLSLLVGIPLGIAAGPICPRQPSRHAGAGRDADRARIRLPHARRDLLLDRAGRRSRVDDDLRDPAGDPHHGARHSRRSRQHRRSRDLDGRDPNTASPQGAAPARTAAHPARRQPDDPLRAFDGRDRGPDRRRRTRSGRHHRHLLEPGARARRRTRDRRHGNGARPLDRGDRRPDGSGTPAPGRVEAPPLSHPDRGGGCRDRDRDRGLEGARRRKRVPGHVRRRGRTDGPRSKNGCSRRFRSFSTTCRTRPPGCSRSRSASASSSSRSSCSHCRSSSWRLPGSSRSPA